MNFSVPDPLSLLPYQSGLVVTPLEEGAAKGESQLDSPQRAITIGEPVPIVFCRRVNDQGGVFVSPGATEGRYTNNATTNELTVNLHLVLSEGDMEQLQLRDVYQRACRVGTWLQTYDRRAGTWAPGNYITEVAGTNFWNCPYYCGTQGTYDNMTTLSYQNNHADGDETWNKQVHCFVRSGINVTRILDNTLGPSNNVIDLALYLIRQSSRFPESMLDLTAMADAAEFCDVNGLYYNGEFKESTNLEDWLDSISSNFLLRVTDKNGKKGFRPRLPVNANGTIKTTAITPVFTFTEDHVLPNGYQIEYISLDQRRPILALVLWRQQPTNDIGIIRAAEVKMAGTATNGPYEQYDLSQFCATEDHAIKVGAYYVAKRYYITHSLRLNVAPSSYNSTLIVGDIVRVRLRRETNVGTVSYHDYLYEVERINRAITGTVTLDLIHFPIDSEGRSLVGLAVDAAVGPGYELPTGRLDFNCDIEGRDEDTTPLTDSGETPGDTPTEADLEYEVPIGEESPPDNTINNPTDPFNEEIPGNITGLSDPPLEGETANVVPPCASGRVTWYRVSRDIAASATEAQATSVSQREFIKEEALGGGWEAGSSLVLTSSDIDYWIVAEASCPDPGSPDGFGDRFPVGVTNLVEPDTTLYTYARWNGTINNAGSVTSYTSAWINYSNYLTICGLSSCGFAAAYITAEYGAGGTLLLAGPAIGPVPWRASVTATTPREGNFGGSFRLGGLAQNANLPACSNDAPSFSITINGIKTYSVSGTWEFSNNQSTVLRSWKGAYGSSDPILP